MPYRNLFSIVIIDEAYRLIVLLEFGIGHWRAIEEGGLGGIGQY